MGLIYAAWNRVQDLNYYGERVIQVRSPDSILKMTAGSGQRDTLTLSSVHHTYLTGLLVDPVNRNLTLIFETVYICVYFFCNVPHVIA